MTTVTSISTDTLIDWLEKDQILLIDIREMYEYIEESIPRSIHVPGSSFHPEAVPQVKNKKVVFYCAAGVRSERIAEKWQEWTGEKAFHYPGGMYEWKKRGLPFFTVAGESKKNWEKICKILSIIMIGTSLSTWFLSPLLLVFNLFLGVILWMGPSYLMWLFSMLKRCIIYK